MNNTIPLPIFVALGLIVILIIFLKVMWDQLKLKLLARQKSKGATTSLLFTLDKSLQRMFDEKERKIQQQKDEIAKLEESKVVNITHIEHVQSYFSTPAASSSQSDVVIEANDEDVSGKDYEDSTGTRHKNLIFKKFMDGKPLNIDALFDWIEQSFLPRLNANYEWFALYRVLRDMNLFESGMNKISKYADQMNRWFPDAPYPCVAGEVRRYNKGYLGDEPFEKWDRKVFRARMEDKQSMDGFERLTELCSMLLEELAQELKTGKLKG